MRNTLLSLLLAVLSLGPLAASDDPESIPLPPELQRVLSDYEAAWKAGDAAALAALFTHDGFISGDGNWVRGSESIERQYATAGGDLRLRAIDFSVGGNVGFIVGAYGYGDRENTEDYGRFLLALERNGETGPWLIAADLDHENTQPSSGNSEEQESESSSAPFTLPVPDGWRTETIPFPLAFAPDLPHEGLEEVRFAPGMFDPEAEDFWSYTFVWWIEPSSIITAKSLASELVEYFSGLATQVAASRGVTPENPEYKAEFKKLESSERDTLFSGKVTTLDAFATNAQVDLNVLIEDVECRKQGRRAVFFSLSPQPLDGTIWKTMQSIRDGFRCEASS